LFSIPLFWHPFLYAGSEHGDQNISPQRSGSNSRRDNVILPPSWGKTSLGLKTIAECAHRHRRAGKRVVTVLYVTPRLELVDQVLDPRYDHILEDVPHDRMIVASDTIRNVKCTTKPHELAEFLDCGDKDEPSEFKMRFLICTYASLPKVTKALRLLGKGCTLDLAIFDEAHTTEGVGERSGHGLYDANLPIDHRLFMTATPQFSKNVAASVVTVVGSRVAKDGSNVLVPKRGELSRTTTTARSFDHQHLYGPCVHTQTSRESVASGRTVPLTLYVVNKAEIASLFGVDVDSDDFRLDYRTKALALAAAFVKLDSKHVISFHSRNLRAQEFETQFVKQTERVLNEEITTVSVNGNMPVRKRQELMKKALNSHKSVIANCKLLSTGVDEPKWDLLYMADPVRSPSLALQMMGRVSRVPPGKTRGYVLIPLLVDPDSTEGVLDETESNVGYLLLWTVFEAMVAGDPVLRRYLVFVAEKSKRLGRPLRPEEYPDAIQEAFLFPQSFSLKSKNKLISGLIMQACRRNNSWDRMYDLLEIFCESKGHCNVPASHIEDGANLGNWLGMQRRQKKKGGLPADRQQRLEEIGVVWDPLEAQWEHMSGLIEHFKKQKGHCNVPDSHIEDGANLGNWLGMQRRQKKKGGLPADRQQRLEEIGVVLWDPLEAQWEHRFGLFLEQFKKREGHCNVPRLHIEDGANLGNWLGTQRKAKKKGGLLSDRERRLEALGVVWRIGYGNQPL
jgi:superfamily II DNA or RNA helicase